MSSFLQKYEPSTLKVRMPKYSEKVRIPKYSEKVRIPKYSEKIRILPQNVNLRQIKYLNNIIEQDHRSSATRKAVSEITDNPSPFRLSPYRSMSSW